MSLRSYQIIAGSISIIVVILCLVSPLLLYPVITGVSWNSDVPDWMGWLVIIGGGIGAGLSIFIHRYVIHTIGGYPESVALRGWYRSQK